MLKPFLKASRFLPGEPLLSVSGPCWQVEMVEAAYLNVINAQFPIATKAARPFRLRGQTGVCVRF